MLSRTPCSAFNVSRRIYSSFPTGQSHGLELAANLTGFTTHQPPPVDDLDNSNPPTAGPFGYPPSNPLRELDKHIYSQPLPRYRLHCHSSRNNTITTFTTPHGSTIAWFSGGSCGFKKGNRASYEAGYQCAVRMFRRIEELKHNDDQYQIDLFFKGFGQGREALQKALLSGEGELVRNTISSVTDRTPLKIGGTRSKKTRRL